MKIFTRVVALSVLMLCFIIAVATYLYGNPLNLYETGQLLDYCVNGVPVSGGIKQRTLPVLTIFTTIKETGDIPHHQLAFNIVITNWPSFAPFVRPVVFLNFTNSSLADKIRHAGWDVLQLEATNKAGTPYLKDMFRTVFDTYESALYGFANADLLFDYGLVKTVLEVQNKLKELNNNVLVMGRRTNVDVDLNNTVPLEEFQKHNLRDVATRKGKLFMPDAIDYFFFTKEGCLVNWSKLANVVIGRPGYDNYLVAMAIRHGVNVIDATNTVLAVHMSEKGKMFHGSRNKDGNYNKKVIGKFNYYEGLTSSANFNTAEDFQGNVLIVERRKSIKKTQKDEQKNMSKIL